MTDTPAQDAPPAAPQPRRRKPPRRVTVTAVSKIAPRLVSVAVTGEELDGFAEAAPTAHLKVMLPPPGADRLLLPEQGPDGPVGTQDESLRPVVRTYTPRRYDPATKTLEIQFVLHGVGPASEWAERVTVGDEIAVAGPGGRFAFDPAEIRIKKGEKVEIRLTSLDVPHGLAIPELGFELKADVGQTQEAELTVDTVGTYDFKCNVMCGEGHRDMKGVLIVE